MKKLILLIFSVLTILLLSNINAARCILRKPLSKEKGRASYYRLDLKPEEILTKENGFSGPTTSDRFSQLRTTISFVQSDQYTPDFSAQVDYEETKPSNTFLGNKLQIIELSLSNEALKSDDKQLGQVIKACPCLKKLSLSGWSVINQRIIKDLLSDTFLEWLAFVGCNCITETAVASLKEELKTLEILRLSNSKETSDKAVM
jgi:hypothetical protein